LPAGFLAVGHRNPEDPALPSRTGELAISAVFSQVTDFTNYFQLQGGELAILQTMSARNCEVLGRLGRIVVASFRRQ
jgi:hypothetical protein